MKINEETFNNCHERRQTHKLSEAIRVKSN